MNGFVLGSDWWNMDDYYGVLDMRELSCTIPERRCEIARVPLKAYGWVIPPRVQCLTS